MSRIQNLIPSFTRKPAARDNAEPTVRPWYEVKEAPEAWGLTVYLPGVGIQDGQSLLVH